MPKMVKSVLAKLAKSKYTRNGKWMKKVTARTVIMHSIQDDLLPYVNAGMLYDAVSIDDKKLINILGPHAHPFFTYENLVDLLTFIHIESEIIDNRKTMEAILDIINSL